MVIENEARSGHLFKTGQ